MKRIALIGVALALGAAAPQEASPPPDAPAAASTTETCLPPLRWAPGEGTPGPVLSRNWYDCTYEENDAAIQRQCTLEQQPGTDAHASCLTARKHRLSSRRFIAWARSRERPAAPPAMTTTWETADHACRGQTWRLPSETLGSCIERLVATDALFQPLPTGREPAEPRCRRESVRNEDGSGFSVSVRCQETTTVPAR